MAKVLTKESLKDLYIDKGLSTWAIERLLGISRSRVYVSLKRYGIKPRNLAQSHVLYNRDDFSGDSYEKAYLLGFTIGDLRVRKHNKGDISDTISIACGSTKSAQIKLIERLFSQYGRVWKSKTNARGVVNIEAFVNRTFQFLLPDIRDYRWCAGNKKLFFAFLGGFTDAEGSLYVSNNQSFIAWGNYDAGLLQFIQRGLKKFGIFTRKIHHDALKNYVGTHGYARNKNYYHLSVGRKEIVRKLLEELQPFLLHEDKKKGVERLRKNLATRGVAYD